MSGQTALYSDAPDDESIVVDPVGKFEETALQFRERASKIGMMFEWELNEYTVPAAEQLAERLSRVENLPLRRRLSTAHFSLMVRYYADKRDRAMAAKHRDWSHSFDPEPTDTAQLNSVAYVFMADGLYDDAERLLRRGSDLRGDPLQAALISMNLGVLKLIGGNAVLATEQFQRAIDVGEGLDPEDRAVACLLIPIIVDGDVKLNEVWNPNVVEAARDSLKVAMQFMEPNSSSVPEESVVSIDHQSPPGATD
jgi:hypothetical protein